MMSCPKDKHLTQSGIFCSRHSTLTLTECTSESLCNDNAQACEAMCGGLWANETDLEATATYCWYVPVDEPAATGPAMMHV
jgi:hypothetical protein